MPSFGSAYGSSFGIGGTNYGTMSSSVGSSAGGGFGVGGLMATQAIMSAIVSIYQGKAIVQQAELNARMFEQQAAFSMELAQMSDERYDIARNIELTKMLRAKSKMTSTLMANVGASGLDFTGSPVSVLLDSLTQAGIDEEITKYNFAMEKAASAYNLKSQGIGFMSKASQSRYEGQMGKISAYSTAFSDLLKGATRYKLYTSGYKENPLALLKS